MFNRQKQQTDPRVDASRRASLAIAWGVAAAVAYLGLIYQAVQLIVNATNGQWSGGNIDQGIVHAGTTFKQFGETYAQLATIVVAALPIFIVATIVLGIVARVRPRLTFIAPLLIACGVLGLAASLLLVVALVANPKNGIQFAIALITIVIVSVLLRLQRGIRRFFRRSPALASLLFAAVTVFYLIISNSANISSLMLEQVDVWLSLLAFAIVAYCGVTLVRIGQRLRGMGGAGLARPGGRR
ncbi:MAG TPA: hypothetical protein VFX24_14065 [Ktedonobacterales bacterium]|jgi:hypothetical protein|nr:hypothetical protein [Ktedonobacterales bacterium]